ncbi:MAG: DNA primase [Bacteroidales bacterium]|nr:DNA primase [Bacteroidales bacterium]
MIDHETVQRILDTARIEEVIGEFVSLKKRGANHIGCCPFHNEKTPSFYVSPSKGIYKCFGCGEAGDVVTFLRKHEHYTYPEALQYLAKKYNIEIRETEQTEEQKTMQAERDALFHVSAFAQKTFADWLFNNDMGRTVGLSYFRSRGMSEAVIRNFGLGYSLDEWTAFTDHAVANGYSNEVLEKSGLTIVGSENGKRYDRFRGRVMFPIYSISGRVLGFSGRILSSGKQTAKYVNSPDSEIYNKSRTLYGLYQARGAISKQNKCYLVEGNIDVISMHQSGIENTVASCGTSLTTEQIRLIKRYTTNVTVLYDGDSAGIKATLRAVNLLFAEEMHVRMVLFPDGEDPDSYAQKYGSTRLQEYLDSHEDNFIMFKTRVQLDEAKTDPIRKAALLSDTAATIALVNDPLERATYIQECAHLLQTSEEALTAAVAKARRQAAQKRREEAATSSATEQEAADSAENATDVAIEVQTAAPQAALPSPAPATERHLIELLLNYGNHPITQTFTIDDNTTEERKYSIAQIITSELEADGMTFSSPVCQRILKKCCDMVANDGTIDPSAISTTNDNEERTFAIGLMLGGYEISSSWHDVKKIYVPTIESNLRRDLEESLFAFKKEYLNAQLVEKRQELLTANAERQMVLLREIMDLEKIQKRLGTELHQVITPHSR